MSSWFGGRNNSGKEMRTSRRFFPRLEELEARTVPSIFTPAQIRHAYSFDQITFGSRRVPGDGAGQTIAIIEAYHDPSIAADLRHFDRAFGLPDAPQFRQVNKDGGSFFPGVDSLWSLETALDVEWAHVIAPRANLLLVEANSGTLQDLLAAVNYARYQPGVVTVSMSWGSNEFAWESSFDGYFTTPAGHIGGAGLRGGISLVASSGDTGAGTSYPAVSPNVLAVGGTSLRLGLGNNYGSESAWSGSGGGISLFEPKPSYQVNMTPGSKRSNPDVAFNSDPNTGYYVYDSVPYAGYAGWFEEAGTSVAAPIWAALLAIADQGRALNGLGSLPNAPAAIYSLPATDFHGVIIGSNGYPAGPGYNLVTGRGTPYANLVVRDLMSFTGARTITVLPRNAPGYLASRPRAHPSIAPVFSNSGTLPDSISWMNAADLLLNAGQSSKESSFGVTSLPTRTDKTPPRIGAVDDYRILQSFGSGLERSFSALFSNSLGEWIINETFDGRQADVFEVFEREVSFR